jgi:hypothetical protein
MHPNRTAVATIAGIQTMNSKIVAKLAGFSAPC